MFVTQSPCHFMKSGCFVLIKFTHKNDNQLKILFQKDQIL